MHICRLASAIVTSQSDKCQNLVLSQMAISVSFMRAANAQANRLTWAFVTVPKYHVLAQMEICVPEAKALVSLHICTG